MKKAIILILASIGFSGVANANLMVVDTNNGTTLTNNILGSGVTVSNISVIGNSNQSGTFTNGLTGGIGIDEGIVLTTGTAQTAASDNTSDDFTVDTGTGGNAALSAIVGEDTFNQNVLQFDFTTTTGDLFFDYVFASEEYNEFVDSEFNDIFALFVDGVNIARAPDNQVVAINTVNCGNPFNASQVTDNCAFYNNNDLDDGGPFFNIEYDGFTNVFTAEALDLGIGDHTMIFAIADTADEAWDSAIFIAGGSFSGVDPGDDDDVGTVPEPSIVALFAAGLFGIGFARRRKT